MRRWLILFFFLPLMAWAAEIEIIDPKIEATDDAYVLSADFRFDLNSRLEEAVNRGVVLHFVADFELTRGRWYWLDEKLTSRSQIWRLSYHALTRQYRLSTGGLHQSFATLREALLVLSRLRRWTIAEAADKGMVAGDPYQAALRLHLDITQLPRPFQISALGNKDWSLDSDWKTWKVTLPAPVPATQEAR